MCLFVCVFTWQGDSAKALAVSGLSVLGRDRFGVFPLKGKLLNVREASHGQVRDNIEFTGVHLCEVLLLRCWLLLSIVPCPAFDRVLFFSANPFPYFLSQPFRRNRYRGKKHSKCSSACLPACNAKVPF